MLNRMICIAVAYIGILPMVRAAGETFFQINGSATTVYSAGMAAGDADNDGLWDYFAGNRLCFGAGADAQGAPRFSGTNLFTVTTSTSGIGPGDSALFLDFLNDGRTHIFINERAYSDGPNYLFNTAAAGLPPAFTSTNTGTVSSTDIGVWHGGVVALDLDCDGSLDLVYGDRYVDDGLYWLNNVNSLYTAAGSSHFLPQTTSSSANTLNIINYSNYGEGLSTSTQQRNTYYIGTEVGAFDMNGDGRIDLVGSTNIRNSNNNNPTSGGNRSSLAVRLAGARVSPLSGAATLFETHQVFRWTDNGNPYNAFIKGIQSVAVADYDGDGIPDLFTGQSADRTWGSADTTGNSKLWCGNGSGALSLRWTGYDGFTGAALLPVDWNLDGRIDLFEFKDNGDTSTTLKTGPQFLLWENISAYNNVGFISQTFNAAALTAHVISGVALDYDYDGARDLILNASGGNLALKNPNTIPAGTCLHLKILNPEGHNAFLSHTIHLFDSSGTRIATRILNPQYGYGANDSTATIDFYALDPAETYTAALVKTDGRRSEIYTNGGYHTLVGEGGLLSDSLLSPLASTATINPAWSALKPGNGKDAAYILSAESGLAAHHGSFTGTGYNDTFFATPGNDFYNGSGGWAFRTDSQGIWSATGGIDTIDYRTFDQAMIFNLAQGTATFADGTPKDTFINIEAISGTAAADTFISGAAADAFYEGRAGDDTFHLADGLNDTLIYTDLAPNDPRGGLGHDRAHGFTIGIFASTPGADRIDLRGLPRTFKSHIQNGDTLLLSATAPEAEFLPLLTLCGIEATLPQLLSTGQLLVADAAAIIPSTRHNTPHAWLDANGLVANADYEAASLADTDADGLANWQEYIAGTDPQNPLSRFTITLEITAGAPAIGWFPDLTPNRHYTILGKTNLTDSAQWLPRDEGHRFFKVRAALPEL